jgi:catechol 2,3-dioxygenase-like lactoylglutathione lyase family enzyme
MDLHTGHIGINVTNLERSKKFYQDVFEFRVMKESSETNRKFTFLGDGKNLILTLWEQSEGSFSKSTPGLHHLSFQVKSIEQVKQYEGKLNSLGVKFLYEGIVPHAEGQDSGGIFFEDPDCIRLEIYSPSGARDKDAPVEGAPSCGFF